MGMQNRVTRYLVCSCFVALFHLALFHLAFSQAAAPLQRLEFRCADDVRVTHVASMPGQITLIFKDAFYPMQQVAETQDAGRSVRYENETFIWITQDGVGRLEQRGGGMLAQACVYQPPVLGYICIEDVTLEVQYVNDVATIYVFDPVYGDQTYELPRVATPSGAKFSNGLTTWFVSGEEGNLFEETEEVQHAQNCQLQQE